MSSKTAGYYNIYIGKSSGLYLSPTQSFVEVTEYWPPGKAEGHYSVNSTKMRVGDK